MALFYTKQNTPNNSEISNYSESLIFTYGTYGQHHYGTIWTQGKQFGQNIYTSTTSYDCYLPLLISAYYDGGYVIAYHSNSVLVNPGTGKFKAINFNGDFDGNFSGDFSGHITGEGELTGYASTSYNIFLTDEDDNTDYAVIFTPTSSVNNNAYIYKDSDDKLLYNPNTNTLTVSNIDIKVSHNNHTYSNNGENTTNSTNYIINNVYLSDDGKLSYTYRDASIDPVNNTYEDGFFNLDNIDDNANGIPVITGISSTPDGQISYSYTTLYNPHNTHSTEPLGEVITSEDYPKYIINEVYLQQDGKFYYTYRDATIKTTDISHSGDKDISNTNTAASGLAVITGISMTSDGQLSYNWSYVYDPHDDHGTYTTSEDSTGNQYIINNVSINADGYLSYTYRDATVTTGRDNGNTELDVTHNDSNGLKVITGISVTSDGQLSYCYNDIYHGNTTRTDVTDTDTIVLPTTNDSSTTFTALSNVGSNNQGHVVSQTVKTFTISHDDFTRTDNTATGTITVKSGDNSNSTFEVLSNVDSNEKGHVASQTVKTFTISHENFTRTDNTATGTITVKADGTGTTFNALSNVGSNTKGHVANQTVKTFTISHGTSGVTAGIYGNETASPGFSGTFKIPRINVDSQGHIKSVSDQTITMPSQSHHSGSKTCNENVEITGGDVEVISSVSLGNTGALSGEIKKLTFNKDLTTLTKYLRKDVNDTSAGSISAVAFYATSDINKKNILSYNIDLSVEDIANAPIIKFTWKDSEDTSYQIGSIAQYWENILPESVFGEDVKTLNYSVIGTLSGIINSREIVELKQENKELKQENKELKQRIEDLENKFNEKINKLEKMLGQLI